MINDENIIQEVDFNGLLGLIQCHMEIPDWLYSNFYIVDMCCV